MMSSCAVEVSLSTADWARSGSLIMVSHSSAFAVGGGHGRGFLVAGHDELVEVGGLGGVHWLQREVVDEQQPHLGEPAHLGFGAVVEPGCFEPLEHRVGTQHQGGNPAADADVAERGGQVCFADPDGTQHAGPVGAVEEAQAGQLGPQRPGRSGWQRCRPRCRGAWQDRVRRYVPGGRQSWCRGGWPRRRGRARGTPRATDAVGGPG